MFLEEETLEGSAEISQRELARKGERKDDLGAVLQVGVGGGGDGSLASWREGVMEKGTQARKDPETIRLSGVGEKRGVRCGSWSHRGLFEEKEARRSCGEKENLSSGKSKCARKAKNR